MLEACHYFLMVLNLYIHIYEAYPDNSIFESLKKSVDIKTGSFILPSVVVSSLPTPDTATPHVNAHISGT